MKISHIEFGAGTSEQAVSARAQGHLRLAGALVTFALLNFWHWRTIGELTPGAVAGYAVLVSVWIAFGYASLALFDRDLQDTFGLPAKLLIGYLTSNMLLFFLGLILPFGLAIDFSIVCAAGLLGAALARRRPSPATRPDELPGFLLILLGGIAATLWCTDIQAPTLIGDDVAVFRTWPDTFIHSRMISTFAASHSMGSINDIRLAGLTAPVYHFASYFTTAWITLFANIPAIDAYASFQLPFGIFLTGLGAFCLFTVFFGRWAALAGALAILALPDAYQQGFGHRYLSYNFLAQVNLGMLYGIACAALAWVLMIEGCRKGSLKLVFAGFVFLGICLLYKAHIFVANAFVLCAYACIFFTGLRPRIKVILGAAFVATFITVIWISQKSTAVPVLRLDFSGIAVYVSRLLLNFDAGFWKTFFNTALSSDQHGRIARGVLILALLAVCTFGVWIAGLPIVAAIGWRRLKPDTLAFPFLVIGNYFLMAMGMALDDRGVGTPDELLNRPLVWAYFVVAGWTVSCAYFLVFAERAPRTWSARVIALAAAVVVLAWPLTLSRNLQTFPQWKGYARYEEFNAAPACLVKAARYIRANSGMHDIVQDSNNDPRFIVTALAERQLFVGDGAFMKRTAEIKKRVDDMRGILQSQSDEEVDKFMRTHAISWFLLRPDANVSWNSATLNQAVYACGGYRVLHF